MSRPPIDVPDVPDAPTRDAATLAILRDGPDGLEILVTVRPRSMRFMGGATVFPGGGVSAADRDPRWEKASTLSLAEAAARSGEDAERALGFYVCALRESFEEVGFILGGGDLPVDRSDAGSGEEFLEDCLERGVVLALDELVPAGRWATPIGAPVRFDTRFFCVRAPDGWEPRPDPREVESCTWITPGASLDELSRGEALMAPPTIEMLQLLAKHDDVESVLRDIGSDALTGAGNLISVRLSPLVHVVLAPNPGVMTGPGTNTYIVGTGPSVIIDPAVDDAGYVDEVVAKAGEVSVILVTHRHSDHVGGALAIAARTGAPIRAFGPQDAGGAPVVPIADGDAVSAGGTILRTLHCPGHASDHLCWWMEGAATLFAGDNVLGEGTAVIAPPDGDMRAYLSSLHRLLELHIDRIYPGHFRWLDGGTKVLQGYIDHRRDREKQVLDALTLGSQTVEDVVARVYTDTPPHLHPVAAYSVLAHLEMLEAEEKVRREKDLWSLSYVQ
jgi:glyoxylase-like metal-dependent hydrolase (beta-lactamase superfamily II)/8-oxo-dGTP pyrophosphatase MutT (NUDIX family)